MPDGDAVIPGCHPCFHHLGSEALLPGRSLVRCCGHNLLFEVAAASAGVDAAVSPVELGPCEILVDLIHESAQAMGHKAYIDNGNRQPKAQLMVSQG